MSVSVSESVSVSVSVFVYVSVSVSGCLFLCRAREQLSTSHKSLSQCPYSGIACLYNLHSRNME